jgi:hypothetical protein
MQNRRDGLKLRTCCGSYSPLKSRLRSEQITDAQLALFEAELKAQGINVEDLPKDAASGNDTDDKDPPASPGNSTATKSARPPRRPRI